MTTTIQSLPRLLFTVQDAAKMTGFGKSFIYQEIARGRLPAIRKGRSVRITAEGLQQWIESEDDSALGGVA